MNTVTKSLVLLAVLSGVTGVGLAFTRSSSRAVPADPELTRDLELAAATSDVPAQSLGLTNPLENAPLSAPEPAPVPRKAEGPRRVASRTPTARSAPAEAPAEGEVEASPMILTPIATNTTGSDGTSDGVALPRPVPAPYPGTGASGDGDWGSGGSGRGGSGAGIGTVIGVVLRGGGVHGDNCEAHDRGRARPPVYYPNPGGVATGSRGGSSVVTRTGGVARPERPPMSVNNPVSRPSRGGRGIVTGRTMGGG